MTAFLVDWYLWIKAIHILFVIAWMAGLLITPRYMVLHSQLAPGSEGSDKLLAMEAKLRKIILTPSIIGTWVFGLLLVATLWPGIISGGWFHVKLLLVLILSGYHGFLVKLLKEFKHGERKREHKFYRMINEVPFLLAIVIVIMVVVKPF